MIGFDFEYYRPATSNEAVKLYESLQAQGKRPVYYAGGTEIVTFARLNQIETGAVIDINSIRECRVYQFNTSELVIGATVTLTHLAETSAFPLLSVTGGRVADHTARNQITIGGNICGEINYKEALLPFLLAESNVIIAGNNGYQDKPIMEAFNKRLQLEPGECLVQIVTDRKYLNLPYFSVKKRKIDVIDYPLLTLTALKIDNTIRVAFSGLCGYPFRSREIETILNNHELSREERIEQTVLHLPAPVLDDWIGSAEYRLFVLKNTLEDMYLALEGESL
ncbi:FAD binding domain-containing protein [Fictibacillus sp. Mic-4]|uniref:FAD binding domain-containing protein n=1 Tax=Fictibacillus sp. Mic-4 TaxID=3132826 RepID=UPI003CE8C1AF